MAFLIDAFAVTDEQYLGGFVPDVEGVRNLVGDGSVVNEVEVVEVDGVGWLIPFEPVLDEGACGATDTVFEDNLGAGAGFCSDLIQLALGL